MKLASLEAIVEALIRHETRYLIAGGLAVAAHGYGRVTFDVDIVVELQTDNVRQAMLALATLEYRPVAPVSIEDFADPTLRKRWIEEKNMVVFGLYSNRYPETPVDVFVTEPFDFDKEYRQALVGEVSSGLSARFVGMEALIRMKEAADREKDREDIRQLNLLQENPNG